MKRKLFWWVLAIGLLILTVLLLVSCDNPSPRSTPLPQPLVVEYRVYADKSAFISAELTLIWADGERGQMSSVSLPKTIETRLRSGDFAYISAQLQVHSNSPVRSDNITCEILVNNRIWKKAKAFGNHSIATCSGVLP